MKKFPSEYTEKTSLHNDDLLLVADSQDSNAVKKVKRSTLRTDMQSGMATQSSLDATNSTVAGKLNTADYTNATTSTAGKTKLSSAPVDPANPIAVGDNDPRMPTAGEKAALAGTGGSPSAGNKYVTADTLNASIPAVLSLVHRETVAIGDPIAGIEGEAVKIGAVDTTLTSMESTAIKDRAKMTDTQYIDFYTNGSALKMRVYQVGVGYGTAVTLATIGSIMYPMGCRLTDTSGVVTYGNASTQIMYARGFSISGNTITIGTEITIATGVNGNNKSVIRLSDTHAMSHYYNSTGYHRVQLLQLSGTLVAPLGSHIQAISVPYNSFERSYSYTISSTQILLMDGGYYSGNYDSNLVVLTHDIGAGTITAGTTYSTQYIVRGFFMESSGSGRLLLHNVTGSTYHIMPFTRSGTVITYGTISALTGVTLGEGSVTIGNSYICGNTLFDNASGTYSTLSITPLQYPVPLTNYQVIGSSTSNLRKLDLGYKYIIGFSKEAKTIGQSGVIAKTGDLANVGTALVSGQDAYLTLTGSVSTSGLVKVGKAVATNRIIINI